MIKTNDKERVAKLMDYRISDMQSYEYDDSEIIEWFITYFNFTEQDFKRYGFENFVKDYYDTKEEN